MLATHRRNLDKDCSEIEELEHAPVTTDKVESGFAVYDKTLQLGASIDAMLGVAHAQCLKLMDTEASKLAAAKNIVRKKQKKQGQKLDFDVEVKKQVAAWDFTSFSSIPRDVRWKVIKNLRTNYKKMVVEKSKSVLKKHDDAGVARQEEKKAAAETAALNRSLNWHKTAQYDPVATAADLRKLIRVNPVPEDLLEDLRDALRVRRHCYGQPLKDLPNIFCATSKDRDKEVETNKEVKRLLAAFERLVETKLPAKLKPPTPYFTREDVVAPTELALQEKARHLDMVAKAWEELNSLLEKGIFKVSNKTRRQEIVYEEDAALIGSEFEDDRID